MSNLDYIGVYYVVFSLNTEGVKRTSLNNSTIYLSTTIPTCVLTC